MTRKSLLPFPDVDFAVCISYFKVLAAQICLRDPQPCARQQIDCHPLPNPRQIDSLSIDFSLFPDRSLQELDLLLIEVFDPLYALDPLPSEINEI
jgi:hypothetical protein